MRYSPAASPYEHNEIKKKYIRSWREQKNVEFHTVVQQQQENENNFFR